MIKKKETLRRITILLVEIVNRNLGDNVIADNAEYLLLKVLPQHIRQEYIVFRYNIYSEDYALLRRADLIIFAGGGLIKYKQESFYHYTSEILRVAEEQQIPVYFNCVGVEGYEEEDERCQQLKNSLNYSCVKGISVRDDIETLKKYYLRKSGIRITKVIDPAVLSSKVYGIMKDNTSRVIGLGIIRDQIFADYGIEGIEKEDELNLWCELILEIEKQGYEWQLFTNGLTQDHKFALEVLEAAGRTKEAERYFAKRPICTNELVGIISRYAGIIAGRMHSNIIAYALKVPGIALVWNNKLLFWGKRIGYQERFIQPEQFDTCHIIQVLLKGMKKGVRKKLGVLFCETRMQYELAYFIKTYGQKAAMLPVKKKKAVEWEKKLVAVALGGAELRYTSMNHLAVMKQKYEDGFRKFEADIRLTCDGRLVCVNGWSERTYERLGLIAEDYEEEPPSYEVFMRCKSFGVYETADFEQLIAQTENLEDCTLFLDIGKPSKKVLSQMISEICHICQGKRQLIKRLLIRVQTRYDLEQFAAAKVKFRMAYYMPSLEVCEEKNITAAKVSAICQKNKVKWITMSKETLRKEVVEQLHDFGIKVCVFSFNTLTEIEAAMKMGVDLVGTQHISIKMLKEL